MGTKNGFSKAQILAFAGGIVSIISVFLPWFSAKANDSGITSSLSVNGLGSVSGSGILLTFISEKASWEFQGIGVLALGIVCITVAIFLREKLQSIALFACGLLIIGGGVVNIRSIGDFSGGLFEMQSGAGYGLYIVILSGAMAAAGGVLAWKDMNK
jgi:lipoprotein signal peptidase